MPKPTIDARVSRLLKKAPGGNKNASVRLMKALHIVLEAGYRVQGPLKRRVMPWDIWTDGAWHEIDPAEYGTARESLRAFLRDEAVRRGLRCSTRRTESSTIRVRFAAWPR